MAVANLSFAAQVDDWVRETEARMTGVFRQSTSEVISDMQRPVGEGGNMPVDLGFLRSSIQVGVNEEPVSASRSADGQTHAWNPAAADLVIAGAEIGDTIVAAYSAEYAPYVEYGAQGRPPRRFVGLSVAEWQKIVSRVSARLKARVNGR